MQTPARAAALVLLLWSLPLSGRALADERIEGIVLRTKVTHCDVTKAGGCAGTLTLARPGAGKAEPLTLRVPLGTPISCAGERMYLHALQGKGVVVTLPGPGDGAVRAISVAETEPC